MNIFIYSCTVRPLCLQTLVREATLEMIKTWFKGELAPRAAFCFAFFNAMPFKLSSTSASATPVLFFFFGDQYFLLWWTLYVQKLCFLSHRKCLLHIFTSAGFVRISAQHSLHLACTSLFRCNVILPLRHCILCDLTFIFWLPQYACDVSSIWFILSWLSWRSLTGSFALLLRARVCLR